MAKTKARKTQDIAAPIIHGAEDLPSVTVDNYNIELRDKDGFIGDRARKSAFLEKLDDWRKRVSKVGDDPLGDTPTKDLSKKKIDALLHGDDKEAAALVMGAIDDFAGELTHVLSRYLKQENWKHTERIVVGGGFRESAVGELAIARAMVLLKAEGCKIEVVPIRHHPDDAGLIGAAHLMPAWMLKGHEAILAVDIGGTNIRAGVVELRMKEAPDLSKARVWKSTLWRHADDTPRRGATIEQLVDMLKELIGKAEKAKLIPAPLIGIACPGIIEADGSIDRGGQNLPGGNWESERFNLPEELTKAIPEICDHPTFVIVHNDAVVQGLSQIPFMQDVNGWGVLTIGTGLGNAHFTNRNAPEKPKSKNETKR
ncbi:glucokinase [Metarhizobium album]|uniref:Glucokinase n=1 Tax=Metarhizobium album TaxID=2182425 RepID=A0A2U2DH46_9HYPH|nr:ROK family protein [Rhizobium album]PWE52636.1 glucokinase [Rhizobium album]